MAVFALLSNMLNNYGTREASEKVPVLNSTIQYVEDSYYPSTVYGALSCVPMSFSEASPVQEELSNSGTQ